MQGFAAAGGPTDLAQLQSTMQAIEIACSSIQMHINPATAEATILSLLQSPQPYKTCQFILENSLVANARFQAAAAIREAAIREWGFLTSDDKRGLISFCICYVMQHASSPDGFVQSKVSSVAAQLMKRGWLDFTTAEKETFFYQVPVSLIFPISPFSFAVNMTLLTWLSNPLVKTLVACNFVGEPGDHRDSWVRCAVCWNQLPGIIEIERSK
ncbi:uncharacterized protein LOC129304991 isoform X7 [Prosopis cineraria]|uniref:uncharacterized protein LOC129304991 isoform X7 n=1 Tax=Prosopis cineraria TaxID=364024 RepID=UPI0024105821|nr:uncharacterized protein LOC129304991 isoform X7 [Prosopis cineraria]